MGVLSFGPWEPDSAGVDAGVLAVAKNVYPTKNGHGPVPSLQNINTNTLPARCVGMFAARTTAGGWLVFAGTQTHLYRYESSNWVDVSRLAGGVYAVPVDEYWSFTQFGSKLIAANFADDPQVFDVDSASNFSLLSGSPPKARYVAVVNNFVVLAALSSDPRALRNSAIENETGWTIGVSLCDEQTLPDGGRITGIAGGEYGYVLQERSIRHMIFQPGSDIAFRFERVEQQHGASAGYSLVATANAIFFLADDGFYSFSGNGLVPIGAQRVNGWFQANSDTSRYFSVLAFSDPFSPRVGWAFYNSAGSVYLDRVIFYDWQLDRWSYAEISVQYIAGIVTAGVTLEDLDVYGSIDGGGIPYPFDSRVWEGGAPVVGAINSASQLSFLEGSLPLTATLAMSPLHLNPGYRSKVTAIYPLGVVNGAAPTIRVGKRENTQNAPVYTDYTAPSALTGVARFNATGRVHDFELIMTQTSGTNWTHMQGLNIEAANVGMK